MIGKTISHYKILEKLGEGGMGVVYKAEDVKLKRTVALKFLPPELTRDPEAKERFIQEAQAASALDHPNICTIHEIDETADGQLFIVMACYDGETLKQKIKNTPLSPPSRGETGGCLAVNEVIDIAIQIAQGLVKAHEHGIFHRDIKPGNIMITKDGMVKILDFGLAKLAGQVGLTKTGTTVGTIAYMSPEQTRGDEVDHRTDIWSFGVVLYEMVTGKLPFRGEYDQAVMYSIMNEQPEALTGVPMELEQIVGKCLEKQTDDRYQSSEQVLADLKKLHKDIDTATSRITKSAAAPQARQKKRRTAIVALAAVLFVMVVSYLGYMLTSKEIEVDDKTVAIMYIENQTGEAAYGQQANLIIPQIYQQLFANHKDIILPSIEVRNQIERIQKAETIDKKASLKILNDARVKYRVTALIQKTGDDLNYILEMTKPGKNPLVWQESLTKSDSITSEDFAQTLADWIEVCIWVDEFEARIHKERNFPSRFTTREIYKNWLSKNICANKAFYQGDYLTWKSQFRNAIPYFKEAWKIEPEYIIAAINYAVYLCAIGQSQTGINILEQLRVRSSDYTHFEQLQIQFFYEYWTGTPDRGFHEFRESLKYEPYPDLSFFQIGNNYYHIGDFKNASEMLEKHVKSGLNPTWEYGYIRLWQSYNKLGLQKKALKPLKVGLKRNPNNRRLMTHIIEQYLLLGNKKEAAKWFVKYERASRIDVESMYYGYRTFGDHYLTMGDFEKADEYYQKALSETDITADQIGTIAWRILLIGKYDRAEDILLNAIERFPDDVFPYNSLSWLYRSKKDYDNMLKLANKAYALAPSNAWTSAEYHIARALSFTANNDSTQAQVEWSHLIDESFLDNWLLGCVYSLKGDVELALENLEISFEKGFNIPVISYLYDPDLDNVRNDPRTKDRFAEFLERVKATYPALAKKKGEKDK